MPWQSYSLSYCQKNKQSYDLPNIYQSDVRHQDSEVYLWKFRKLQLQEVWNQAIS